MAHLELVHRQELEAGRPDLLHVLNTTERPEFERRATASDKPKWIHTY